MSSAKQVQLLILVPWFWVKEKEPQSTLTHPPGHWCGGQAHRSPVAGDAGPHGSWWQGKFEDYPGRGLIGLSSDSTRSRGTERFIRKKLIYKVLSLLVANGHIHFYWCDLSVWCDPELIRSHNNPLRLIVLFLPLFTGDTWERLEDQQEDRTALNVAFPKLNHSLIILFSTPLFPRCWAPGQLLKYMSLPLTTILEIFSQRDPFTYIHYLPMNRQKCPHNELLFKVRF